MDKLIISTLSVVVLAAVVVIFWLLNKLRVKRHLVAQFGNARFEKLIEFGSDCVIIVSAEFKTTYVSPSVVNILGYSAKEVTKMSIQDFIHPDDVEGVQQKLLLALQNPGKPIQGHTSRVRHKNGSWRWLEAVITNFIDDPEINGIVDNFRDVTDRVNAENKLKEINERLLLATRGSELGIWDFDYVTGQLIWDDTMHKIHGTDARFVQSSLDNWLTLIHADDRSRVKEKIEKSAATENSFDITFRIVHPDSSIRHIRALAQIYKDEFNKPVRMVGTNMDVTSNKEYEITLEQILFDISHIIRNPVTKILGLSSLMEDEEVDDKLMKEYTEFIKESAEELDKCTTLLNETYHKKKLSLSFN